MKHLIDAGYITTKYRYRNEEGGEIHQLPSMITFTLRGIRFLVQKRIAGAKQLLKKMLAWINKDDRRFPKEADILRAPTEGERKKNLTRLQALLDFL